MWSQFILCLLVGLAFASNNPAWEPNTEYVYQVKGRTLSSLHEANDQYSGIFIEAKLTINPYSDGNLQGRITDAQYAQIHSHLPDGWWSHVQESQLSYKPMTLSEKPFKIEIVDGLIKDVSVEKEVLNYQANMIKSFVSQLQWDMRGKNAIDSPMNNLPSSDKFDGVFKTMEDTVTGKTETLYEIHRLPEYWLQSGSPLPVPKLKEDDQLIEVVKTKNYTNAEERPSYHYGFGQVKEHEPTANKMGKFFIRESLSRAYLTGQPSRYLIQKAFTVNKIYVNPTFNNKEMGSVVSMVNVSLSKISPQTQQPQELTNPVNIGDLVYTYEHPFADNNQVHEKQRLSQYVQDYISEEVPVGYGQKNRGTSYGMIQQENDDRYVEESSQYSQYQPRPELSQAPSSPLLPTLVGYQGRCIKQKNDIIAKALQLITEIAQEVQGRPEMLIEKSTVNKFTILCTLVRLLNEQEFKSLADQSYTQSQQSKQYVTWKTFLDAAAEAGTGPALLTFTQLIESKKIERWEAAELMATLAHSVRTPTLEYMRHFYELITKPEVKEQQYLNETAILSYTDLVYKVYVNRNVSHNQFPVHSFGSFFTKEGREFVKNTVIPYLTQQLHEAISHADSRKIHVYVRALGNVGHRRILQAFEPYLEGQKQSSQFQRMLMVLALDRLVAYNPEVARSVLYKTYRNKGEIPEVRVITIFHLIRTNPPVEMLQRMAESTNIEQHEQVIAAIKSVIETAADSQSPEHHCLKEAAASAKPLLTRKYYAGDYSFIDLRDYIVRNMDAEFAHKFLEIGSPDSNWPKVVSLGVRGNINGMNHKFLTVSGMISSVRDLMNVLREQTQEYQQARSQRSQHQTGDSKWSSSNIANLLKYESEEREQLEAIMFAEIENMQALLSVDNQTLESIPRLIHEQEEIFKNGRKINFEKFKQVEEMALSFPTEMGLPFLYTYDMPLLVRIEGTIKAFANPPISSNDKLHKPDQISAEIALSVTISSRAQSELSFVTLFENQKYTAGYHKSMQVHFPILAKVEIDVKSKTAEIECEIQNKENTRLLHYSTWPYTSRSDVMSISPVSLRPNTIVVQPDVGRYRYFDVEFGKKHTGLALRAWGHHPVQSINLKEIYEMAREYENYLNIWQELWDEASLKQTEVNIEFIPNQCSVRKFYLRFGAQNQYKKEPDVKNQEAFLTYEQLSNMLQSKEPIKRQQELIKHASSGIVSADTFVWDMEAEFEGDKKYLYNLGVAASKSNAEPKSRTVAYFKKNADKPQQYALQVKGYIPNTNGLDLTYSLNSEPKAQYEVRLEYGQNEKEAAVVSGTVAMSRSKARKQHLMEEEPLFRVCKNEMQQGNFQLPACQNLTIESNYLDDIKTEWQYAQLPREHADIIEGFFKGMRLWYYPMTEIASIPSTKENTVSLRIQFQPQDLRQVNFTVRAKDEETKMFNISMWNHVVKTLVVPHPVFHLKSRAFGVIKGWQHFRPTCVIDQTAAQTFSNRTYPLSLENKYTVVMHYIPKEARLEGQSPVPVPELLKRSYENYVVLVRQGSDKQKELLVTFNHPDTQGKTVEINMKPQQGQHSGSNPAVKVLVDNQEVKCDDKEIVDLYNGLVQIYSLPNGEVKVEWRDAFYLIFDGKRVKLSSTSSTLHDSIRGLCGRFSKDPYEDFSVPAKCIVRDYNKFVQSFTVEGGQAPRPQRSHEFKQQCISKDIPLYADVISDRDAGRENLLQGDQKYYGTQMRTHYVEENGDICFSIRPVPKCKQGSSNVVSKMIPFHCLTGTKAAYHFKNQIDQGGNPDFSRKEETKKIRVDIPTQCN